MFSKKTTRTFNKLNQLCKSKGIQITSVSKRTFKSDAQIDIRFNLNAKLFKNIKNFGGVRQHSGKYLETYYDTVEDSFPNQKDKWYLLAKQGKWLCNREGQWYLRTFKTLGPRDYDVLEKAENVNITQKGAFVDTAKEAFGEREVRWDLNLQQDWTQPDKKSLVEDLKSIGIVPYAKFQNHIVRFALNNKFDLTIERFDFGYTVGKLTTYVTEPTPKKYNKAANDIVNVINALDLDVIAGNQEGIINYLGKERLFHYNDLLKEGAIQIPTTAERVEYGRRFRMFKKYKEIKLFNGQNDDEFEDWDKVLSMSENDFKKSLSPEVRDALEDELERDYELDEITEDARELGDRIGKNVDEEMDDWLEELRTESLNDHREDISARSDSIDGLVDSYLEEEKEDLEKVTKIAKKYHKKFIRTVDKYNEEVETEPDEDPTPDVPHEKVYLHTTKLK